MWNGNGVQGGVFCRRGRGRVCILRGVRRIARRRSRLRSSSDLRECRNGGSAGSELLEAEPCKWKGRAFRMSCGGDWRRQDQDGGRGGAG